MDVHELSKERPIYMSIVEEERIENQFSQKYQHSKGSTQTIKLAYFRKTVMSLSKRRLIMKNPSLKRRVGTLEFEVTCGSYFKRGEMLSTYIFM